VKCIGCALLVCWVGAASVWADGGPQPGSERPTATQPAPATSPSPRQADPVELTRAKWTAVVAALRNRELTPKARADEVERIAVAILDFPLMAKLALGRTNWRKFTPPQRKQYVALVVQRVKNSYRNRIIAYEGEEVKFRLPVVDPPKQTGTTKPPPKGIVQVPIELVTEDSTVTIVHKFRRLGKVWKIYDIEIEGVSILLTYRSQFDDILRRGTPEDLIARLQQKPSE